MFHWVFEDGIEESRNWQSIGDPSTERRTKQFRSWRGGGRWHAACDLAVPRGTPVLAICDGTVRQFGDFYEGTWALTVEHEHEGYEPFLVRYGEMLKPDDGGIAWSAGDRIEGGQEIARVGQLDSGGHMLHFELYATNESVRATSLSIANRLKGPPAQYTEEELEEIERRGWDPLFQRRRDLANPSQFLQAIKRGDLPPQPTAFLLADAAVVDDTVITFTDEEVEPVVGQRAGSDTLPRTPMPVQGAAGRCRERISWRSVRRCFLPSWLGAHLGELDEPLDRRGPDE